jgi:hypothetical protein
MNFRPLAALVLLAGCTRTRTLDGQVVDIWGNPVAEATVVLEGHTVRPTTDAYGNFSLPWVVGKQKIKAGKEGYIQEHLEIEVVEGEDAPNPIIKLYPKPEEVGFYLVGPGEYARLEPEPVVAYGNELGTVTGIKEVRTRVESDPLRVVFATELRMDQIMRLGLELDEIEYTKAAPIPDVLGTQEIEVNLYVAKREIAVDVSPMRSRNAYLITVPEEDLEPGWYAFTTQELLSGLAPESLATIPEGLRVAFPFELH